MNPPTDEQLRAVAVRYAAGVDRRDRDLFLSAFHPDASLVVHRDGAEAHERRGHDEIGRVVEAVARYSETFHLLGQSAYELRATDATEATGEVHCVAHHHQPPRTMVMYIRYQDRYRPGDDGAWRIAERHVLVDWQETRTEMTAP